jgi:hypothetical protein
MYKGLISKIATTFCMITLGVILTTFTPITSKAQVSQTDSCIENSGLWYIVDQYVTNPSAASPYYTKQNCHEAALGIYGCIPSIQGQQYKIQNTSSWSSGQINYLTDVISDDYRKNCINKNNRSEAACGTNNRFFTCSCKKANSSWHSNFGLSTTWTSQDGTRFECVLEEFVLKDLKVLGTSKIVSPMGLLNMIVNLLAAVAIFIFIINSLQGALLYVRSSGEEAGLKQARHKVTANIVGIIFVFVVTRVIMFVYEIIQSQ